MLLPLFLSNKNKIRGTSNTILAGDVGATKTNLGFFRIGEENKISLLKEANYQSKQHESITEILDDFLKEIPLPQQVCFGVAGPVLNEKVNITNLSWKIDSDAIAKHIGVANICLINDLEATAYGLAMLTDKDVVVIHKGMDYPSGNAAVIAPGTGLGEAGMFWDGKSFHPFATEGGHCDFAPRTKLDFELYEYLQKKSGHVSWEHLVCGPGIFNIYQFLRDREKWVESVWLGDKIKHEDPSAAISKCTDQSALCKETMRLFIRYLAQESANLVLKLKATGGLFIGGGIAPQIIHLFEEFQFNSCFCNSGRLNFLLEKVPVKIILNTKTALLGAAWYGAQI